MNINGVNSLNSATPLRDASFGSGVTSKKVDMTEKPDTVELSTKSAKAKNADKPKSSILKKIGVGLASVCVPGLGQLINGQPLKAGLFFAGPTIVSLAGLAALGPVGALAGLALHLYGIGDAVYHA